MQTVIAKNQPSIWRYGLSILLVFLGAFVGSLPYQWFIQYKINLGEVDQSRVQDLRYLFSLVDLNINLIFMMLPFVIGMLVAYLVLPKMLQIEWQQILTYRSKLDYGRIFYSFSIWVIFSISLMLIGYFINPDDYQSQFQLKPFLGLLILSIVLIPIQTTFEELVFRSLMLKGLGLIFNNKWWSIIISAVVFGLMHLSNPEVQKLGYGIMIFYIGTGVILGLVTILDNGLELALGFHAANNLITALLVTTDWSAFQTYAVLKDFGNPNLLVELLVMLLIYPIFIYILHKKYRFLPKNFIDLKSF